MNSLEHLFSRGFFLKAKFHHICKSQGFFFHSSLYLKENQSIILVQTTHRKKNEGQQIKRSSHCQQKSQQKNPSGLTTELTSPDIQKEFVQAACIKRDTATVP